MSDYGRKYRNTGHEHERTYANVKEVDSHFGCYEHLRDLPRQQEALEKLRKIASLVKPIMRKRGWRIGALTEFLPNDTRLLGRISLRWEKQHSIERTPSNRPHPRLEHQPNGKDLHPATLHARSFPILAHGHRCGHHVTRASGPFASLKKNQRNNLLISRCCCRLAHVVHGAHDGPFHALWNQLRDEHYSLALKGYTGEGFLGQGRKLGGGGRRVPLSELSRQARANAAEKRKSELGRDGGSGGGGGGRRLGGAPVARGADMRRVIAEAATRRAAITQGCASGSKDSHQLAEQASKNGFRTQAEEDDANDRAIAQALVELMEEEERQRLEDEAAGRSGGSQTSRGLGWSAETGLYIDDDSGDDDDDEVVEVKSQPAPTKLTELTPQRNGVPRSDGSSSGSSRSKVTLGRNGRPVSRLVVETEANAATGQRHATSAAAPALQPRTTRAHESKSTQAVPTSSSSLYPDPSRSPATTAAIEWPHTENWKCPICTLENPMQYLCCDACGVERPSSSGGGISRLTGEGQNAAGRQDRSGSEWTRTNAGHSGEARPPIRQASIGWSCSRCGHCMESKWWTCALCGTMKASS
ncbi:MAG: hypothetical protein M1822_002331 [Bathelium mastoideum]|nr:MAG: hypothetical protein M1822_002331 [Bathelium mastoideum]